MQMCRASCEITGHQQMSPGKYGASSKDALDAEGQLQSKKSMS